MSANALEREIIEKFRQLDAAAKERVLQQLVIKEQPKQSFDYEAWLKEVGELRERIQARLGEGEFVGALDLLDELREEES